MNFSISKYLSGFSSMSFAKIFRYCILILANIILAKSYLNTSEIGLYEKFLFFVALTSSFWVNGIIKTFLLNKKEDLKANYFNYHLSFQLLGVTSGILLLTLNYFSSFINFTNYQVLLLVLFTIIQSPTYLIEYIYLNENENTKIIKYSIINYSVWILAISIPIILNKGINEILLSLFIYSTIKHIWLLSVINTFSNFRIKTHYIKHIFIQAGPLLLLTFMGGIGTYIDGLIVSYTQTKEIFAIYSYGAKELPIALILATSLDQIYVARLVNSTKHQLIYNEIKKKGERIMHIVFPITILLMFTSFYLFENIFNSNFIESATYFNIYLLVIITRVVFPQTITLANHKKSILIKTSLIEVIFNITVSLVFYNIYGIVGIAYATILAFILEKSMLVIYNQKVLKVNFNEYTNTTLLFGYSGLLIICHIISLY